jgi:hypothetical protein
MTLNHITETYFEVFSPEFTGDLLRLIAEQCKSATIECLTFYPKEEAMDLLGDVRRAKVESKARKLAEDYPEIIAECRSSRRSGNGNYHTKLKGGNALLTIHKVQFKASRVRKAVYRDSYASQTTYSLFDPAKDDRLIADSVLYAQLKYGVDRKMPQALAFAVLDFPDENGDIVHSLDLLSQDRYSNIPMDFIDLSTTENIEDNLNLNLRPDAKKKQNKDEASGEIS